MWGAGSVSMVMNRQLTVLFAAAEALLVVAIGVAIPLLPLTLLWGIQYGLSIDWATFWRGAVDLWLLGHGVDVTVTLDPTVAAGLGLAGSEAPIKLTIAALGFSMLTILLGVRAGRRVAETPYRLLGELVSLVVFAGAALLVTSTALHPLARPSLVQGTLLPTLVFALGLAIGVRRTRIERDDAPGLLSARLESLPTRVRLALFTALRGGAAAAALVVSVAAALTAAALAVSYAKIITLYEGLHTDVLGGIAVTLGQLAFLPNLVVWTASWLIGPGFAIGTGSTVSPLATQLGPIPAIPMLGALPTGDFTFGFVGLLVPVIAGFLVGATFVRERQVPPVIAGIGIGLVGGIVLGLLAWFSAGAAGPGRLVTVGPDPWSVGGWAALELGLAAILGAVATRRASRPDR